MNFIKHLFNNNSQHSVKKWLVALTAPIHFLKQCQLTVDHTPENIFSDLFYPDSNLFIELKSASESRRV